MLFFFIFTSFLTLVYIYTGLRLIPSLVKKPIARGLWGLLIFFLAALFLHLYLRVNFIHPALSRACAWIGYSGLGLMSYLCCLAALRDLILLPPLWAAKLKQRLLGPSQETQFKGSRRSFLIKASGYSIAALGSGAAGIGWAGALQHPKVVKIDIKLENRHKGLSGLKLVQFTDLHVGPTIGYDYVQPVCDTINSLAPDIIAFTGDLADGSPEALSRDVEPLKTLQAPLGRYFITGNHEYYSGAGRWIRKAQALGFTPLINEHRVLPYNNGQFTLAGVTDIRAEHFDQNHQSSPQKAAAGSPGENFKVLLAHQPTSIYEAALAGFDLQLSGHTHGGQYFPFNYFILLEHPYIKGMYQYGSTQLYVSQGTGYWGPPLRLGTFPEITLFQFI